PGSRFIVVHGGRNVVLKNNVGLRSLGHGVFFESGDEIGNTVVGNLTVDVRGPEELPNFEIARFPWSYHYWVRSRNTLQHNVAVGTAGNWSWMNGKTTVEASSKKEKPVGPALGMVMLPHHVPNESQLPAEASELEFFGTGSYGFHLGVSGARFIRPVVGFATQSGVRSHPMDRLVLEDPFLFYNGENEPTYPSQIFVSSSHGVEVRGGLLVGKVGLHIHYRSTVTLDQTAIQAQILLHPTYWELGMVLRDCSMDVEAFFQGSYPRNRNAPGLLRVERCTGKIKGKQYSAESPFSADFTKNDGSVMPQYKGSEEWKNGRRLADRAPDSGFLRLPGLPRGTTYGVLPAGWSFSKTYPVAENLERWKSAMVQQGYPDGFPPGTYHVKIVTPGGAPALY
ncbi:MAG: hypothetical protein ACREA0_25635, partial [bacterium]